MKLLESAAQRAGLSGVALLCSVPPSGNGPMTNRFLRARFWAAVQIVRGFVFKQAVTDPEVCRRLFFDRSVGQETLSRYMRNFQADSVVGLDLAAVARQLPALQADVDGRADWLTGGHGDSEERGEKGGGDASAAEKEVDVSVVDIRVGKIVKAWEHPEADKLWAEEIDVGLEKPLQVCSGLREFKTLEDMTNAEVLVICNMKPNKMRGLNSEAMVLCASNEAHTKVDFVKPPSGAKIGERVTFEGFEGEPEKVLNPKKKQLERCCQN